MKWPLSFSKVDIYNARLHFKSVHLKSDYQKNHASSEKGSYRVIVKWQSVLHLFIINSLVMPHCSILRKGGSCTNFYLFMDLFEIIQCGSFPMHDTYVNWFILVTAHEISMVCLNSFSLALEVCFIVSSWDITNLYNFLLVHYPVCFLSSLPDLLWYNSKQSKCREYLYIFVSSKMPILKINKCSWWTRAIPSCPVWKPSGLLLTRDLLWC